MAYWHAMHVDRVLFLWCAVCIGTWMGQNTKFNAMRCISFRLSFSYSSLQDSHRTGYHGTDCRWTDWYWSVRHCTAWQTGPGQFAQGLIRCFGWGFENSVQSGSNLDWTKACVYAVSKGIIAEATCISGYQSMMHVMFGDDDELMYIMQWNVHQWRYDYQCK